MRKATCSLDKVLSSCSTLSRVYLVHVFRLMLLTTISEEDTDEDVEMDEVKDDSSSISSVPDPYDMVYTKLPRNKHTLKPVEDCKHCYAKRFEHESKGFSCHK